MLPGSGRAVSSRLAVQLDAGGYAGHHSLKMQFIGVDLNRGPDWG